MNPIFQLSSIFILLGVFCTSYANAADAETKGIQSLAAFLGHDVAPLQAFTTFIGGNCQMEIRSLNSGSYQKFDIILTKHKSDTQNENTFFSILTDIGHNTEVTPSQNSITAKTEVIFEIGNSYGHVPADIKSSVTLTKNPSGFTVSISNGEAPQPLSCNNLKLSSTH
jgi:hypothetical protein